MERKPVITYAGNSLLFSTLESHVVNGMPLESIEWRRSYGRAPKTVTLEADFVPFQRERTLKNVERRLIGVPVLHTFWTDCTDLDTYKAEVKDSITQWLAALKNLSNPDWMVIVVEGADAAKKANKLLPRATVIDKIRSDFASKHPDRCLAIFDTSKADSRAAEAWQTMLFRIRQLSLGGLTRILGKFEEDMRGLRERRVDPAWEFCQYFIMQEELALVYEVLGLDEDALVQYDELDALFSQFIINAGAGDVPNWMHSFCQPPENWDGVRLATTDKRLPGSRLPRVGNGSNSVSPLGSPVKTAKDIHHEAALRYLDGVRTDIIENDVSLLQFRNYLFSRQCSLLLRLARPSEVAQRTLPFLQTCRQELKVLKIEMPPGSLACWGVLSVLEILLICQSLCEEDVGLAETLSKHTAPLWAFAKNQLLELGQLCGLMPDKKDEPTSDQLLLVVQLITGISDDDDSNSPLSQASAGGSTGSHQRSLFPQERLREAISSEDGFNRHFLELCELAMGTYKHVGRLRAAREIGLDLANFYLRMNQPVRALPFFVEACAGYSKEGWHRLATDARLKIAECAKTIPDHDRYLKTLVLLASSNTLPEEERLKFQKEIPLLMPKVTAEEGVNVNAEEVVEVVSVKILHESCNESPTRQRRVSSHHLVADSEARAELVLKTRLPLDLTQCEVSLKLRLQSVTPEAQQGQSGNYLQPDGSKHHHHQHQHHGRRERKGSHASPSHSPSSSMSFPSSSGHSSLVGGEAGDADESWTGPVTLETYQLRMMEHLEHKLDHSVSMAGIGCQNFSRLLSRKDSVPAATKARLTSSNSNPFPPDQDVSILKATNVTLSGNSQPSSVIVSAKLAERGRYSGFQLIISAFGGKLRLTYTPSVPFVGFSVFSEPPTVALDENIKDLFAGIEQKFDLVVRSGTLNISKGEQLVLKPSRGLQLRLPDNGELCESLNVPLPELKPFSDVRVTVVALCNLNVVPLKESGNSLQHRISASSKWMENIDLELFFERPFVFDHRVLTACEKKLIRIALRGARENVFFSVSSHSLDLAKSFHQEPNSSSLDATNVFKPFNPNDQVLLVSRDQAANYVWELDVAALEKTCGVGAKVKAEFSADFELQGGPWGKRRLTHVFELANLRTLFAVRAAVEPAKGSEFCRAGAMCVMNVHISPLFTSSSSTSSSTPPVKDLMYEILADQASWAANGRTSGVIKLDSLKETCDMSLELMPLRGGSHPLPTVRLSKYLAASDGAGLARVEPFAAGQIYDFSRGSHVQVLPPASHHHQQQQQQQLRMRHPSGSTLTSTHSSLDTVA